MTCREIYQRVTGGEPPADPTLGRDFYITEIIRSEFPGPS